MTNYKVASDSNIKQVQIKQEIVTLLFSDVKKSFVAAIAVACMLLAGLSNFVKLSTGLSWLGLLALTYILRLCLGHQLKKDVFQTVPVITWLKRFRLSINNAERYSMGLRSIFNAFQKTIRNYKPFLHLPYQESPQGD